MSQCHTFLFCCLNHHVLWSKFIIYCVQKPELYSVHKISTQSLAFQVGWIALSIQPHCSPSSISLTQHCGSRRQSSRRYYQGFISGFQTASRLLTTITTITLILNLDTHTHTLQLTAHTCNQSVSHFPISRPVADSYTTFLGELVSPLTRASGG